MKLILEYETMADAITSAFGIKVNNTLYIFHGAGRWYLTDYSGTKDQGMILCIRPNAERDPAWTKEGLK